MKPAVLQERAFLESLVDAFPSAVFVVDQNAEIYALNATARALVGKDADRLYQSKSGVALRCIHTDETPRGCGASESCHDCIIATSIARALNDQTVVREKARVYTRADGVVRDRYLLVSAKPFPFEGATFVLLTLENIEDLIRLSSLLPICAGCKKIRNTQGEWETFERYLSDRIAVDFSHSMCPSCMEKWYPNRKKN